MTDDLARAVREAARDCNNRISGQVGYYDLILAHVRPVIDAQAAAHAEAHKRISDRLESEKTTAQEAWNDAVAFSSQIAELQQQERRLREALEEITEGRGTFDLDHHQHCKNTVEDMKALACAALKEGGSDE